MVRSLRRGNGNFQSQRTPHAAPGAFFTPSSMIFLTRSCRVHTACRWLAKVLLTYRSSVLVVVCPMSRDRLVVSRLEKNIEGKPVAGVAYRHFWTMGFVVPPKVTEWHTTIVGRGAN